MKQITIIAPVQDGLVANICRVLGDAGINLDGLDAYDARDLDVVTLAVDQYDKALQVLRDAGFDAVSDDAVVVCIKDEPGSLARITERLHQGDIEVSSVRILQRQMGLAMVALATERREEALKLIHDLLVVGTT
jgi:hypothetical protein